MVSSFGRSLLGRSSLVAENEVRHINNEKSWYEGEIIKLSIEKEIIISELETLTKIRNEVLGKHEQEIAMCEEKIRFFRAETQENYHKMVDLFERAGQEYANQYFSAANALSKTGRRHRDLMRSDRRTQLFWVQQLKESRENFVDMYKDKVEKLQIKIDEIDQEILDIQGSIRLLDEEVESKKILFFKKASNY